MIPFQLTKEDEIFLCKLENLIKLHKFDIDLSLDDYNFLNVLMCIADLDYEEISKFLEQPWIDNTPKYINESCYDLTLCIKDIRTKCLIPIED